MITPGSAPILGGVGGGRTKALTMSEPQIIMMEMMTMMGNHMIPIIEARRTADG